MTFSNLNAKYVLNCDHEILEDIGNASLHVTQTRDSKVLEHFLQKARIEEFQKKVLSAA